MKIWPETLPLTLKSSFPAGWRTSAEVFADGGRKADHTLLQRRADHVWGVPQRDQRIKSVLVFIIYTKSLSVSVHPSSHLLDFHHARLPHQHKRSWKRLTWRVTGADWKMEIHCDVASTELTWRLFKLTAKAMCVINSALLCLRLQIAFGQHYLHVRAKWYVARATACFSSVFNLYPSSFLLQPWFGMLLITVHQQS